MHRFGQLAVMSTAVAFAVALGAIVGGGNAVGFDHGATTVVAGTGGGTSTPPSRP